MIGELWSWCSKQRCSKQRQASQVFVPLHGPAIGCGLPSWRSSALVGATSFNKGQLLGDLSYFISGSNAPGNWRKWVEGPGSVGHSAASARVKEHARPVLHAVIHLALTAVLWGGTTVILILQVENQKQWLLISNFLRVIEVVWIRSSTYSSIENEMVGEHHQLNGHKFGQTSEIVEDRGAWHAAVHGVTKRWTGHGDWTTTAE